MDQSSTLNRAGRVVLPGEREVREFLTLCLRAALTLRFLFRPLALGQASGSVSVQASDSVSVPVSAAGKVPVVSS